jgi:hypothetical protein
MFTKIKITIQTMSMSIPRSFQRLSLLINNQKKNNRQQQHATRSVKIVTRVLILFGIIKSWNFFTNFKLKCHELFACRQYVFVIWDGRCDFLVIGQKQYYKFGSFFINQAQKQIPSYFKNKKSKLYNQKN